VQGTTFNFDDGRGLAISRCHFVGTFWLAISLPDFRATLAFEFEFEFILIEITMAGTGRRTPKR